MNIFFRELKSYRKALIGWSLGFFFLVASGMGKYSALSKGGEAMNQLFAQMPKALKTVMGLGTFDLTKPLGFYGVLFPYIAVMAGVHAVLLGSGILAKEERDRTSEFLFVKPVSRRKVVTAKLLAALFDLIVVNLVTWGSSVMMVDYFDKGGSANQMIATLMGGVFFLQLIFLGFGAMMAALSRKPKRVSGLVTGVLLGTFVLSVLVDLNTKIESLKYLTPFKYFDAKDIIPAGHLTADYMYLSLGLILVFILVTYLVYPKRDLAV